MLVRRLAGIIAVIIAGIALSGCPSGTPAKTVNAGPTGDEVVIGVYADKSGSSANWGMMTDNGVQLALSELPDGKLLGKTIRVQFEDTRGDAQQARTAVTKLIDKDGAIAIIGEIASKRSLAGGEICQKRGVPMISPASTNPAVTKLGDFIFRVCYIDDFQGAALAAFAVRDLKAKSAAVLTDVKEDYCVGLANEFKKKFVELGGRIVAEASYSGGDPDFRPALTAIKDARPDVVMAPAYYSDMGTIAKQGKEVGITAPYLGGDGWESDTLLKGAEGALEGSFYSNHYAPDQTDPASKAFTEKFKARFGHVPDAIGALGYDSAKVLFAAIERAGSFEPQKIRDALAQTKDFPGITGKITLDADRNASKSIVILKIEGNTVVFKQTITP